MKLERLPTVSIFTAIVVTLMIISVETSPRIRAMRVSKIIIKNGHYSLPYIYSS